MTLAARLHAFGAPLRIEEVHLPEPGRGEVRVEIAYAGVNPIDGYTAAGRVAADGPLPRTLGREAAGYLDGRPVVVSGDGLAESRDGVYAAAAVVPRSAVTEIPEGVALTAAAASGIAGLTAWNVAALCGAGPGDRVLVLGAAGGVGLPLVSLLASRGAAVWGQTGSQGKEQAVRDAGADQVVVTDAAGLVAAAREFRPTVITDPLGGAFTPAALEVLAPAGTFVVYGTSAGADVRVELRRIYRNGQRILGYGGLTLSAEQRRAGMRATLAALADGRMRIPIGRMVPLESVNEAFRLLTDRAITGKVLLAISGD